MANYERGTYEPDDVRVFDASDDDDDAEGSRLPLLIVIALIVLAAFGGVVWLAYTQGVARGRADVPRVITADSGPAKVAPANPGGSEMPYKGLKIYEQPAPSDEDADQDTGPAQSQPAQAQPPAPAAVATPAPQMAMAAAGVATKPPATLASPAAPKAASEAKPAAEMKPVAAPKSTAETKPVVAPPAPVKQAELAPVAAAPTAPIADTSPAASTAPAAGAYVLQIGAFKSQGEADAAWNAYHAKHAGLLSGFTSDVKMVDLGAKGTWYRLRIASFSDKGAASALCSKLQAEGGACFLAK